MFMLLEQIASDAGHLIESAYARCSLPHKICTVRRVRYISVMLFCQGEHIAIGVAFIHENALQFRT